ncbi:1-deoxy-D-xylulose-5-phosphate reductoisomerase [Candidatus Pelagibacter sp. Uisw_116]|uniref:1-deoxy-D-xylulose-5-phosphate reductoisomerase n=1 Tax=Candidatus Pelagibacter sp. Uisw_116 TaxID=3230986 RepID=UPI0039E82AD1
MKKKIIILGSTGSIGMTTIKIILKNKKIFDVILLTANKDYVKLLSQAKTLKCKNIIVFDKENFFKAKIINKNKNIKIFNNVKDFLKNQKNKVDYTMCAISGISGLEPLIDIIKITKNLAIANKESIICGWNLIQKKIVKYNVKFIPIDFEHFSIQSLIKNNKNMEIDTIFITASGGPFLKTPMTQFKNISAKKATKHPNWKMGKKISVDSSTLMNKVFEIIEAQRIFKLPISKFKILIHPKSYLHSIVKFHDGTSKLLIHDTSMMIPIFNSLFNDDSTKKLKTKKINLNIINNLNLSNVDLLRFPMVKILKMMPNNISLFETVLVSANDCLVDLFLNKKIKYQDIYKNLKKILRLSEFTKLKSSKPKNVLQIIHLSKYVALKTKSLCVM